MLKSDIARVAYEVNRAYSLHLGEEHPVAWHELNDSARLSCIVGVQFILDHKKASTAELHESWLRTKGADGWRYGPHKDMIRKEHPCFLPFNELREVDQAKDVLFRQIVYSLLPFLERDLPDTHD